MFQKLENSGERSGTKSNITQNIQISILNFNDENYTLSDVTKDKIVENAIDLVSCGKHAQYESRQKRKEDQNEKKE